MAVTTPDADWAEAEDGVGVWGVLLTGTEREAMLEHVRCELIPHLDDRVERWAEECAGSEGDDPIEDALRSYEEVFKERSDTDTASKIDRAIDRYQQIRQPTEDSTSGWTSNTRSLHERLSQFRQLREDRRSLFDDIDQ